MPGRRVRAHRARRGWSSGSRTARHGRLRRRARRRGARRRRTRRRARSVRRDARPPDRPRRRNPRSGPRKPEQTLGHDVALDLVGAGVDGAGEREEIAVEPFSRRAGGEELGVRPEQVEGGGVNGDVGLGPEDLVGARLGTDGVTAGDLARRPIGVELVRLGVHVREGDCIGGSGRAAARGIELYEAVGYLGITGRTAQRESAFGAGGGHGDGPAAADLAEHLVLGDLDVVEEDLGETGLAIELRDRAHGDAGRVHGDEEVRQATVALGIGVGAEDAEAPFGERAATRPCLLSVEDPGVAGLAAGGAAAYAGEVAAGVGLGPALTPDLVTGGHRREETLFLRVGAVFEHGGGEQEDAVLADALGGAGAVVLLLEDEPLEDAQVAAAVLRRPADDGPAVLVHFSFPAAVGLEALFCVKRGEGVRGDVLVQPGACFGPELLVLGAERQVHGARESSTGPPVAPTVSGGRRGRCRCRSCRCQSLRRGGWWPWCCW